MNILFINLYSQKIERGAETFVHQLAYKLKKTHTVTFLKGDSALLPQDKFTGSVFKRLQKRLFLDKPARQVLWFSLKNMPHILRSNYDVVIPLNGFWQVLLLKLVQPFKNYKIVITGHSGPGWDERWNVYLHPDTFVATTKPTLVWAQKTCPWTKAVLIPYAIDPPKLNLDVKHSRLKLEKPIILCPSALVGYKRVDLAIKAVAQLRAGSLLVLGKGPLEPELKKLGDKLLGKRFLLTSVPTQQMPKLYLEADIVTLPSDKQENSPMVFLEALAAGKRVVTTDTPRTRWVLENAGEYVDPTKTIAYAQALEKSLQLKSITTKPLHKFAWPNVLNKYEQLFKDLIDE